MGLTFSLKSVWDTSCLQQDLIINDAPVLGRSICICLCLLNAGSSSYLIYSCEPGFVSVHDGKVLSSQKLISVNVLIQTVSGRPKIKPSSYSPNTPEVPPQTHWYTSLMSSHQLCRILISDCMPELSAPWCDWTCPVKCKWQHDKNFWSLCSSRALNKVLWSIWGVSGRYCFC